MNKLLKSVLLALILVAIIASPVYAAPLGIMKYDVQMWDYNSQGFVWLTEGLHVGIYGGNAIALYVGVGCAPNLIPPRGDAFCAWGYVPRASVEIQ